MLTFNGGEIPEETEIRLDIEARYRSCRCIENLDISPMGTLTRRRGMKRLIQALSINSRLFPFAYSVNDEDKLLLEAADSTLRILSQDGTPLTTLNAPWTTNQLTTLRTYQINDLIYITSPHFPTQILTRYNNNTYNLSPLKYKTVPWETTSLRDQQITATKSGYGYTINFPSNQTSKLGDRIRLTQWTSPVIIYSTWEQINWDLWNSPNLANTSIPQWAKIAYTIGDYKYYYTATKSFNPSIDYKGSSNPANYPHIFQAGIGLGDHAEYTCGGTWKFMPSGSWVGEYGIYRRYPDTNWELIDTSLSEINKNANIILSGDETNEECYLRPVLLRSHATAPIPNANNNHFEIHAYKKHYVLQQKQGNKIQLKCTILPQYQNLVIPYQTTTDQTIKINNTPSPIILSSISTDADPYAYPTTILTARTTLTTGQNIALGDIIEIPSFPYQKIKIQPHYAGLQWSWHNERDRIISFTQINNPVLSLNYAPHGIEYTIHYKKYAPGFPSLNTYPLNTHYTYTTTSNQTTTSDTLTDLLKIPGTIITNNKDFYITKTITTPLSYISLHKPLTHCPPDIDNIWNTADQNITLYTLPGTSPLQAKVRDIYNISDDLYFEPAPNNIGTLPNLIQTNDWSWEAFRGPNGYPSLLTYHNSRLVLASTKASPQTLWLSKVDDLYNFHAYTTNDADPIQITLATPNQNTLRWLLSKNNQLMAGTAAAEFNISSDSGIITPSNIRAKCTGYTGSAPPHALINTDSVIYTARGATKLMAYAYSYEQDAYISTDLTLLATHIINAGVQEITSITTPHPKIYTLLKNGTLAVMTYNSMHQIHAWSRITTKGNITSITSLPNETTPDALYLIVTRQDGTYIETIQHNNYYLDAYTTSPTDPEAIPYTSTLITAPLENIETAGSNNHTAQLLINLKQTPETGLEITADGTHWTPIAPPESQNTLNGWTKHTAWATWKRGHPIGLRTSTTHPLTLQAINTTNNS